MMTKSGWSYGVMGEGLKVLYKVARWWSQPVNTLDPSPSFVASSCDFKQLGFNEFQCFGIFFFLISDVAIGGRIYKFTWVANLLDYKLFNARDNVLFFFIFTEHSAWCSRHLINVC